MPTRKQDPTYGDWSGTRRSMNYGDMPTRTEFKKAFKDEIAPGRYRIRNDRIVGDADLNEAELWKLLQGLRRAFGKGGDEEGDLASVILSTLGFEWV